MGITKEEKEYFEQRAQNYRYRITFRIVERELYNLIRRKDPKSITNFKYMGICDCRMRIDESVLRELITHFESAKELRAASYQAYLNALRLNLFEDPSFTAHFKPKSKYTFNDLKTEASKYSTRTDFQQNAPGHYAHAQRQQWLDEVCSHMPKRKPRNSKYTNEYLITEASKYPSQAELRKSNYAIFMALSKRKLLKRVHFNF